MRVVRQQTLTQHRFALVTAFIVVVVDQLTKVWAVAALSGPEGPTPIDVIPGFFQLALVRNPGAAFGLLEGAGSVLALLAIVAIAVIVLAIRSLTGRLDAVALGLVLGGALGNLVDRVVRGDGFLDGRVIDFLDFSRFPTFNVADSAITIGAGLALWAALRKA